MSYGFVKEHHQPILNEIVDVMIPAYADMPSATEANIVTLWIDEVLNVRHDLRPPFFRALRVLKDCEGLSANSKLTHLQKTDEEAFATLGVVVSGAYFLNPEIKKKLGYPGQISRATEYEAEEAPDFVREGLLDPVIQRGPVYRPVCEQVAK